MKRACAFFILILILQKSFSFDMKLYLNQHKTQNLQTFLEKFPYNEYLKSTSFINFPQIQEDRYLVWKFYKQKDGDAFLYHLADNFLKLYPVASNQLDIKISIGEAYLNPMKILKNPSQPNLEQNLTFKTNTNEAYQIIGYYILGKVADRIEQDYKNKKFDINDIVNLSYINRLKNNKVYVSIEESTSQKIWSNIKRGKYDYLWDRITQNVKSIWNNGANSYSTTPIPNFKQILFKSIYPISKNENLVDIYQLKSISGKLIGHSIWMKRPKIHAKYFSFSVNNQFLNLKKFHNIVLATTGGYTTNTNGIKPDGFTVENGELNNAILLHDRQGLVLFSNGGVRIINLKSNIKLPNGDVLESPFNSILAYSKLLNWCKVSKATVFQTHLLAYGDSILINPLKAPSAQRERRLLALFSDKNGNIINSIFDIKEQYDLALITQEIFNIIASRNLKVEGVVNLDTGSYNILNVFDENGNLINDVIGTVNILSATNLIVYYK